MFACDFSPAIFCEWFSHSTWGFKQERWTGNGVRVVFHTWNILNMALFMNIISRTQCETIKKELWWISSTYINMILSDFLNQHSENYHVFFHQKKDHRDFRGSLWMPPEVTTRQEGWLVRPVCSTVPPRVWQKYLYLGAHPRAGLGWAGGFHGAPQKHGGLGENHGENPVFAGKIMGTFVFFWNSWENPNLKWHRCLLNSFKFPLVDENRGLFHRPKAILTRHHRDENWGMTKRKPWRFEATVVDRWYLMMLSDSLW